MLATPHASCCFGLLPIAADYLFGPLKSLMLPSSGKGPTMRVIQPFEVGRPKCILAERFVRDIQRAR
jgi:hypothetical protein